MAWRPQAATLVGRDPQLAVLRDLVDAVRAPGGGDWVVVTGEAGVGKSRLLGAAVEHARAAGLLVLRGRAVPGGGAFRPLVEALLPLAADPVLTSAAPLRPYHAALHRLVPGWPAVDAAPDLLVDPALVLGEAVSTLLRLAAAGGALLVIEDLHWADPDTLGVLRYLTDRLPGSRTLLLCAARTPVLDGARLDVGPLDRDAAAALVRACLPGPDPQPALIDAVVDRAGGLPLLIEELLGGLLHDGALRQSGGAWVADGTVASAVPPTLTTLALRRLDAMPAPLRPVVHAAAVIGLDVDADLVGTVTGHPPAEVLAALRAAVDVGLLDPARDGLRWRHALLRDAVLTALLPPETVAYARAAAAALTATGASPALAADLYERGRRPDLAAGLLLTIGRRDLARGATQGAVDALTRAVALGAPAADLVRALSLAGRAEDALAAGDPRLSASSGADHAELCLQLARAAVVAGRWDRAIGYLDRAALPDDPRVLAVAADAHFGAGRVADAAALAARVTGLDALPDTVCEALEVLARCTVRDDVDGAAALYLRAAGHAAAHGLVPQRVRALHGHATVRLYTAAGGSADLAEVREAALDAGLLVTAASVDLVDADVVSIAVGPAAGLPVARRCVETADGLGLARLATYGRLMCAALTAELGDLAETDRITSGLALPGDTAGIERCLRAVPELLQRRDLAAAGRLLDDGIAILGAHGSSAPIKYWGLWVLVRTLLDPDDGAAARARLLGSPAVLRPVNRLGLDLADVVVHSRAGDQGAALRAYTMVTDTGWWSRVLRSLALDPAWAPAGEIRALLTLAEADGPPAVAARCRDLLRLAGAAVPRGGHTDVPAALRALGVTRREFEVLTLVRDGLTNAEVAARLFLSRRTVETHVANLLQKTGTRNRAALLSLSW